jgi:hypothetical protein
LGDPEINRGVIPDDGFIVLHVPFDADSGTLSLFLSQDDGDPPLDWDFRIQQEALADSTEDKAQRLVNLGFATTLPEGDEQSDEQSDDQQLALLGYRACVGKPLDDDDAIVGDMVAMHDGGDEPAPDEGGPQAVA